MRGEKFLDFSCRNERVFAVFRNRGINGAPCLAPGIRDCKRLGKQRSRHRDFMGGEADLRAPDGFVCIAETLQDATQRLITLGYALGSVRPSIGMVADNVEAIAKSILVEPLNVRSPRADEPAQRNLHGRIGGLGGLV